jgi:TonB family protein
VLTRFDSGVAGTADVDAAFKAAVAAFTDPPAPPTPPGQQGAHPIRFVTRSGTNTVEHRYDFATMGASGDSWQWQPEALPDADLIAALKNAATMPDDTKRADMLLLLARGNAFTPEMVALYVAAANGITSETERARVFAQPIRIKPVNPTVASVTAPTTNTTINLTPKNRLQGSYYWQRFNNTPDTLNSAAFNGQATEMFTSQNFPGASTQDLNNARKLYELLTGRVQSIEDEFAKGTVPENTGGLTKPVARQKPLPKYTPGAMRQKIQGDVLVDVVVGTDGTVMRARIAQSLDPDYGLDESALATAKQWTFEPGVLKGEKVPVLMRLVLTFSLH